ncbi:MAG: DUF4157 domain-containing protein, partial [Proteobacteria bacterium]|nr:DUF4157 domain-containing protein [Pseudomonadota bacterium]
MSQPGENIEREAEAHAAAVAPTNSPHPTPDSAPAPVPTRSTEDSAGASSAANVGSTPPPASASASASADATSPSARLPAYAAGRVEARRGRGDPLPAATRAPLEDHFGRDFADVRLHSDAEAARLTAALGARAFTSGRDIYLAPGTVASDTEEGRHLLAHELAHVV